MSDDEIITGGCFCKAVRYQVRGTPLRSAYCHCTLCQRLNAAAFILTIHYPADAFKWTHSDKPEEAIETYAVSSKPWKLRSRCKLCGVCVASFNTKEPKWSVWGAQMDRDEDGKIKHWDIVKPTHHIFYGTRMLDIEDGLPKWEGYADVSARLG